MCLSICRFRRVITHRHANHFAQTSYPSNTLILVPLLTLPRPSPPPPAVELSSSATQTFFSSPSPSFNTGVGRFFFSPFVNPLSFRLHYRPSQPSNPSTSFPGIFKNHQSDLSFPFYFYLSLLPFSKGWKYLDIGETRLFSSR